MNSEQFHINNKVNQIKGLIHNIDTHKKYSMIEKFLYLNHDYVTHFEDSQVLSFGITHTKHSKSLTKIFLQHGYNPNRDPAILNALRMKKFKSAKIILNHGFDVNSNFDSHYLLPETLSLIDIDKSNSTLRKVNEVLSTINLFELNLDNIQKSQVAIIEAEEKINLMYEAHPQLTIDIKNQFNEFKSKIDLISKQLTLKEILVEKSIQISKPVQKI